MAVTYSLWKSSTPTPVLADNYPIYSREVITSSWNFSSQSVAIYGVRIYAAGSMIGQSAELGVLVPSIAPPPATIETVVFTVSKTITLSAGWNEVLFDVPVGPDGSNRVLAACRINSGAYVYFNLGVGSNDPQPVPGLPSVSLSAVVESGKVPPERSVVYAYEDEILEWSGFNGGAVGLEIIVGQTRLPGPARAYPLNGLSIGTTAGTAAAGNDSRFPHVDEYQLQRPRLERLDIYVQGVLSVKVDMQKRMIFGTGVIRRVAYEADSVGSGASVNASMLVNAVAVLGGVTLTNTSASSSAASYPVSQADTISISITAVTGTVTGLNVSIWVEYP